tara:strand:+ start:217 stop:504 length:288 start_codon:yes stop_codon:yes gene_type:complete
MKDNKLIAEFMGLSIKEGVCYYTDVDDMFPMGIEVEEPYLPYHTSWDWLMPVVQKCYKIDDEEGFDNLVDAVSTLDIDGTYNAVVEFIKTYNDER